MATPPDLRTTRALPDGLMQLPHPEHQERINVNRREQPQRLSRQHPFDPNLVDSLSAPVPPFQYSRPPPTQGRGGHLGYRPPREQPFPQDLDTSSPMGYRDVVSPPTGSQSQGHHSNEPVGEERRHQKKGLGMALAAGGGLLGGLLLPDVIDNVYEDGYDAGANGFGDGDFGDF